MEKRLWRTTSTTMLALFLVLSHYVMFALQLDIITSPDNFFVTESLFFQILEPDVLSYTYKIRPAKDFGSDFDRQYQKIALTLAEPFEGCSPLTNSVGGSVVMVLRGGCSFLSKTLNAEKAGAVAILISDSDEENDEKFIDMIDDSTHRHVTIPSAFLMGKDGAMIKRVLNQMSINHAVITIPVNVTSVPIGKTKRPPWTLW
ncbi:protease-associated domain-containing protein 1-like [Gigantopelta aegis]|uniref:protease-associated domain-containing protein 1-like n=1 Tax=Gigantopelta aegis TaxID=1735272 RepID=UPI001B88A354|nr:protease-associated domain-containing protein 1-like [Gigantopelta aegis]